MPDERHERGAAGERFAEALLASKGMRVVARNFATPVGEIDRVMDDAGTLVFVEVRTRSDARSADPMAAMSADKRGRLLRAAEWFVNRKGAQHRPLRFDFVVVLQAADGELSANHYADAFLPKR
ncbi:MAG: YraN family protein [Phycisphaerales bacterium]|nr:YraN family protein [Phycisphaerales bacterium]